MAKRRTACRQCMQRKWKSPRQLWGMQAGAERPIPLHPAPRLHRGAHLLHWRAGAAGPAAAEPGVVAHLRRARDAVHGDLKPLLRCTAPESHVTGCE